MFCPNWREGEREKGGEDGGGKRETYAGERGRAVREELEEVLGVLGFVGEAALGWTAVSAGEMPTGGGLQQFL